MIDSSLKLVESLLNRALATDETAASRLQSLQGASLGIHCLVPPLSLWLQLEEGQVRLTRWREESDEKPRVSISGKATDLVRMAMQMADQGSADFSDSGVSLEGDVGVLLGISRAFSRLEIDWEYLLGQLVGEKPARFAFMGLDEARKVTPQVQERGREMGGELVSQLGLLRNADIEAVRQQVRELQYRIDRVQARIKNLEQRQ